ncbi:MAG: DUF1850 domain-containing protein [Armatimonadetes bacterium]|nr:DUF1850 domain-containing protein [Armatimonadota bacterium]
MAGNKNKGPVPARIFRAGPVFSPVLPLILGVLAVLLLVLGWAGRQHLLLIREAEHSRGLLVGFLAPGEGFQLRYIHSVDRLPVYDEFRFLDGELVLTGARCFCFGAGLGYTGEGVLRGENGWDVIDGMHRPADSLPLRVGTVADHTLLYRRREIHLNRSFRGQTLVHLEVVRLSPDILSGLLKGEIILCERV